MVGFSYGTLEVEVFDNTEGVDTCVSCETFGGAWVYCPVFNHIMKAQQIGNLKFDETGEKNRCELFLKSLMWECKNCGENTKPHCNKCVREDGKLVTDELVED